MAQTGRDGSGYVTQLLTRFREGDEEAANLLMTAVYGELRKIAAARLRNERANHSLQASALVNEAYIKLAGLDRVDWQNRSHFFGFAARAMREILVDHARARLARKRGGNHQVVQLDEAFVMDQREITDVLAIDEALKSLSQKDSRAARVVECRYFAGLSIEETSEALGVAPRTVKRDWQVGRAWLRQQLGPKSSETTS